MSSKYCIKLTQKNIPTSSSIASKFNETNFSQIIMPGCFFTVFTIILITQQIVIINYPIYRSK